MLSINVNKKEITVAEFQELLSKFPPIYTVEFDARGWEDIPTELVSMEVGEGSTSDCPGHIVITIR